MLYCVKLVSPYCNPLNNPNVILHYIIVLATYTSGDNKLVNNTVIVYM